MVGKGSEDTDKNVDKQLESFWVIDCVGRYTMSFQFKVVRLSLLIRVHVSSATNDVRI